MNNGTQRTIDQIKLDALAQTIEAFSMLGDEKSVAQKNAIDEVERFLLQYKSAAQESNKLAVAAIALGMKPEEIGKTKLKPELFKSAIVNFILPDELYPAGKDRTTEIALIKEQVYIVPKDTPKPSVYVPTETDVRLQTQLQKGGQAIESFDLSNDKDVQTMQSLVFKVFYAACLYFAIPDRLTKFLMLLITYNDGEEFIATNTALAQFGKVADKTIQRNKQELLAYISETQNAIVQMDEERDEKGQVKGTRYTLPFAGFLTTNLQMVNASGFANVIQELTSKMQEQKELDAAYNKRLADAEKSGDADKIKKVAEAKPKNALDRLPETLRPLAKELIVKIEDAKQAIQAPSTTTNARIEASKLEALKESARKVKSNLILIETPESAEAVKEIDRFLTEGTNFDKSNLDQYKAYIESYHTAQDETRRKYQLKLQKAASTEQSFQKALTGYANLARNQIARESDEILNVPDTIATLDQAFQSALMTISSMAEYTVLISESDDEEAKKGYAGSEYYKARLIEAVEFAFRPIA